MFTFVYKERTLFGKDSFINYSRKERPMSLKRRTKDVCAERRPTKRRNKTMH
jgi:hypothetical protein